MSLYNTNGVGMTKKSYFISSISTLKFEIYVR